MSTIGHIILGHVWFWDIFGISYKCDMSKVGHVIRAPYEHEQLVGKVWSKSCTSHF